MGLDVKRFLLAWIVFERTNNNLWGNCLSHVVVSRRETLVSVLSSTTITLTRNLPESNGADLSGTGTVEALRPIVRLRQELGIIRNELDQEKVSTISISIPTKEQDFKRIFDAYSHPVSYKQRFLDQNAFLVYYTNGYDGPNRPKLEEKDDPGARKQSAQYGARNDAWVAWDNFLSELEFVKGQREDDDRELKTLLEAVIQSVDAYLSQAPSYDVEESVRQLNENRY